MDIQAKTNLIQQFSQQVLENGGMVLPPLVRDELRARLKTGPIYLLGSSSTYAKHFIEFAQPRLPIRAIIDDFASDSVIHKIPRFTTEQFIKDSQAFPEALALNLTFAAQTFEFFNYLSNSLGIRCLDYLTIAQLLEAEYHAPLLHQLSAETAQNIPQFLELTAFFQDELSLLTLFNILLGRLSLNRTWLEAINIGAQSMYFDPKLMDFSATEVFIDCGAYQGDTIQRFLHVVNNQYKTIMAFEPDRDNFKNLNKNYGNQSNIILHPQGVFSQAGYLNFHRGLGSFSRFMPTDEPNGTQNSSVAVVALDKVLIEQPVTFLKMDVEGAELDALQGAARIIATDKPKLAIAVYHNPLDMINIIKLIEGLNPNYHFFLRHHGSFFLETICYAI
jgi:FkbM family methyltransferase